MHFMKEGWIGNVFLICILVKGDRYLPYLFIFETILLARGIEVFSLSSLCGRVGGEGVRCIFRNKLFVIHECAIAVFSYKSRNKGLISVDRKTSLLSHVQYPVP